jgi:hypothetical protein
MANLSSNGHLMSGSTRRIERLKAELGEQVNIADKQEPYVHGNQEHRYITVSE